MWLNGLNIQERALKLLPYGVLIFLFFMFAAPTSKVANQVFYLGVLLPALLSFKLLFKNKLLSTALWPIVSVILLWALFSFISFEQAGWGNVGKIFRHALYVITFISASYYLLLTKLVSVRKLAAYLFILAASYSALSFISFYWLDGHALTARLSPILRLNSPIFVPIILIVFGMPLMQWLIENKKGGQAVAVFLTMLFFLYFYNSRSAMVGLFFGVIGLNFLGYNLNQKRFASLLFLIVLSSLILSYFYGNILNRGVSYRVDIWVSGLNKIADCGWLLGCGFGENSDIIINSGLRFQHAHNLFLSHLINTGLFGLLSLLGVLFYTLYQGIKVKAMMTLGLLVGCAALFFDGHSIITNPDDIWLIFWLPLIMTSWDINNTQKKCVAESAHAQRT